MADLRNNPLLYGHILFVVSYWTIAPLISNPFLSIGVSLFLLIWATLAMAQYLQVTYLVLVKKKRGGDELGRGKGSHLAVLGIFLISFGSFWSGAYGLWWAYHGQPMAWVGLPMANFGRTCQAVGFVLWTVSPEVTKEGLKTPMKWWVLAVAAASLIAIGFYAGWQVKFIETADSFRAVKYFRSLGVPPVCRKGFAVVGSQSRVYHTDASPCLGITKPKECFATIEDAKREGFRAIHE